jgi:succinate dehydrogenase / fumarate reductase, cytochrome b subunit
MSATAAAHSDPSVPAPGGTRAFWRKKIFSFCGIVPLAIYTVWHLFNNVYAVSGPAAFDARLTEATRSPLYRPAIWLFVYLPFVIHAVVGLAITFQSRPNVVRLPTLRNWKYVLQRASAIGVLLFVPAHVYKTKIEPWRGGFSIDYAHMHAGMIEPVTFAVYLLGMIGVAFHLANGLWLAGITWGVFIGPKAQRRGEWLSIGVGFLLLALAFACIFALRR